MSNSGSQDEMSPAWLTRPSLGLSTPLTWCMAGVVLLAALPGLLLDYFPFADAVNHAARFRILSDADSVPALGQFYQSLFKLNTNMGLEFLYVTLFSSMDPVAYLKLANVAIAASLVMGTACLGYALNGSWRLIDLFSGLFVFNYALVFGFLNFALGVGLALLSFAAWIMLRRRPWYGAAIFGAAAAFTLYLTHLFALGLFGLSVICFEGQRACGAWRADRQPPTEPIFAVLIAFVPVTLFALMQMVPRLSAADQSYVANAGLRYGGVEDRLTAIVGPALTYFDFWDFAVWAGLAALIIWLVRSGQARLNPATRWLILALAVLVLLMPARLMDAWGAHFRPGIFLVFVLLASLQFAPRNLSAARLLQVALVLLIVFRLTGVFFHNAAVASDFQKLEALTTKLPPGATLVGVFAGERRGAKIVSGDRQLVRFQYNHATTVATLRADAFTPSIFSRPDVHNLTVQPAYRHLDTPYLHPLRHQAFCAAAEGPPAPDRRRPGRDYVYGWSAKFDYVLAIGGRGQSLCPGVDLRLIVQDGVFTLYSVGGTADTFSPVSQR